MPSESEVPAGSKNKKIVKLQSNDAVVYSVELKAATKSTVVANLIENLNYDSETSPDISLPNVASSELKKIIDFLVHHMEDSTTATEFQELLLKDRVPTFDKEFIQMDKESLINLYMASNYMDIQLLNELCAWSIASTIKGKTASEINQIWNMTCDFTAEELQEVKDGHAWVEQKG